MPPSIFIDFSLPNSTTWFYFSVILAIALFFKFSRIFSLRNWDVLALFAMVPGLLLVQEAHELRRQATQLANAARIYAMPDDGGVGKAIAGSLEGPARLRDDMANQRLWWGYFVLIAGSAYWLLRCLIDTALIERPALHPNLNPAGLAWLALALFASLGVVAVTKRVTGELPLGSPHVVIQEAEVRATKLVQSTSGIDSERVQWWVERTLSGTCHLAVVVGLILVGRRHFGTTTVGVAAATAYLLLPYIAVHLTKVEHVLPSALLVWAVVIYQRPAVSGALLGLAGGWFLFPLLVVPVWAHFYKRRGMGRFLAAFAVAAGISLALVAFALWANDRFTWRIPTIISVPELKNWRVPGAEGFWTGIYWAYRLPVFICALAFVVLTAFWPEPKDLGHVLALSCAHLLGAQLWYARGGGTYVLWYLPLLLLMVFRPTMADRLPPDMVADQSSPV
ncbi:MAG: hypothetical protein ACJ8C4_20225 [Gemmataceae bacterium]